jgi:hypothetical protein
MTPVRVVTPGGPSMLPLRMVAAGTGNYVDIVLYVIGEGRYKLDDLHEVFVDTSTLSFDFAANTSNYDILRQDALVKNDGYSFLTAFSSSGPFATNQTTFTTLQATYFSQAAQNDNKTDLGCNIDNYLTSAQLVGDGTNGTLDAQSLDCGGYTDLSAALTGLHPNRTWITRLEMNLPHEALSVDCKVSLSDKQEDVSNQLLAKKYTSRPAYCPEPVYASSIGLPPGSPARTFRWGILSFLSLYLVRRGRKTRR